MEVIGRNLARRTDLSLVHLEDFGLDYAETLRRWRENLERHAGHLGGIGYDERFRRMWRMYLCYCEAGFDERRIGVAQALLAKPGWRAHGQRYETVSRAPFSDERSIASHTSAAR